jgi:uncharacterized protein YcnI
MRAPHLQRMGTPGRSGPRRLAIAGAVGVAATLAFPPAALAHVSVTPETTDSGKSATIAFRVPDERDDATTTRVEVTFPTDHPLVSAMPQAVPGWTVTVQKQTLDKPVDSGDGMASTIVSSIVWEGGQIAPDTFQSFPVYIGKMPSDASTLTFKALQTYSDGKVERWIDLPTPGGPEPEHPAPTVTVTAVQPAAVTAESTSDTTARVLGGAGLVAGLGAAALAAWGRRRPTAGAPEKAEETGKRERVRL